MSGHVRIWKYGLRPPTMASARVHEQMWRAHRYYNQLVEIERARRAQTAAVMDAMPDIAQHQAEIARLSADLTQVLARISDARRRSRSRRAASADDRARAKQLRTDLRAARAAHRAARSALLDDPELCQRLTDISAAAADAVRTARATCGCHWGTYLIVEQAIDAARRGPTPPHFRRWTGAGTIAVQLQGGLDESGLQHDRRLQIDLPSSDAWCRRRDPQQRTRVRLRIGSDGRDPVWAEWPLIMHRPLPAGSKIMWARVRRERLGGKDRWSLLLTLRLPDGHRVEYCGDGAVAIDVGWRMRGNNLRVAYILGDHGKEGEATIGADVLRDLRRVDALRSTRDRAMDRMRAELAPWWQQHMPGAETIARWRSQARFAALIGRWRTARALRAWAASATSAELDDADCEMFDRADRWRRKDKHLWTWEANLRDKVLRRRRERYRVLAADLARAYRTLVIEDFDLRQTQKSPAPEADDSAARAPRWQQRAAACSELRGCLIDAFAARGGRVVVVDPAYTTVTCHRCGRLHRFDAARELVTTCECGATWDQDRNAAAVLMKWYREWCDDTAHGAIVRVVDHAENTRSRAAKWARRGRHDRAARDTPTTPPA